MHETLQNHNALLHELPESLGATLTRARLSRKLELREVASRIGVDVSVVQALEDDDFQRLGAPVFARNFLVRYARLLELPEPDILERFRELGLDEPPPLKVERPIQRQARMTDVRWLAYPVVVVGVLWLSYVGFERLNVHYSSGTAQSLPGESEVPGLPPAIGPGDTRPPAAETPTNSPSANPMAPALAAIADLTGFGNTDDTATDGEVLAPAVEAVSERDTPSSPAEDTAEFAAPATPPAEDAVLDGTAEPVDVEDASGGDRLLATVDLLDQPPAAEPAEETPLVAVANLAEMSEDLPGTDESPGEILTDLPEGQAQLVLSFNDDCWVEVRDATGERLVRSILNANTVNRFMGEAPFSLTLGNAAAVTSITLNGEPVDESVYSPVRGNVSRFTLEPPQG